MGKWSKLPPTEERFWAWVVQGPECWSWKGSLTPKGYGCLTIDRKRVIASRYSWELHNGPIADGLVVCHSCDNPPCVRPDHLFLGTKTENNADRHQKDRSARGNSIVHSKLDELTVLSVRDKVAAGQSMSSMARELGVRLYTVQQIVHRQTWTHI